MDNRRNEFDEWARSQGLEVVRYEDTYESCETAANWIGWQAALLGTEQKPVEIAPDGWQNGIDTLQWLLNISSEGDQPNARVSTLLDKCKNTSGRTTRQSLELLLSLASQMNKVA